MQNGGFSDPRGRHRPASQRRPKPWSRPTDSEPEHRAPPTGEEPEGPDEFDPTRDVALWRNLDESLLDAFDDEWAEPEPGDFDLPRCSDDVEEN